MNFNENCKSKIIGEWLWVYNTEVIIEECVKYPFKICFDRIKIWQFLEYGWGIHFGMINYQKGVYSWYYCGFPFLSLLSWYMARLFWETIPFFHRCYLKLTSRTTQDHFGIRMSHNYDSDLTFHLISRFSASNLAHFKFKLWSSFWAAM